MTIFGDFRTDLVSRASTIWRRSGDAAGGPRFRPGRGRAAARACAWRPRDQRGDGAGRRRQAEPPRGSPPCWPARAGAAIPRLDAVAVAGPGFINIRLDPRHSGARSSARSCAAGDRLRRLRRSGRASRSMWNSSPPTRPGRCMSGTAAARWSATRWRPARQGRVRRSRASITSTTPAPRSMPSRARLYLRYREALGEADRTPFPDGLYPGEYLKRVGRALAAARRRAIGSASRRSASGWRPVRDFAIAADDGADPRRSRRARRRLTTCSSRSARWSKAARRRGARGAGRARADLYRACWSRPRASCRMIGSRAPQTLFRATQFGDDVDRPLKKSDGSLDLFRRRHRLSPRQVPPRLRQPDRRLGRRSRRLCQAHAGGGEGASATARRRSTSSSASSCICSTRASRCACRSAPAPSSPCAR